VCLDQWDDVFLIYLDVFADKLSLSVGLLSVAAAGSYTTTMLQVGTVMAGIVKEVEERGRSPGRSQFSWPVLAASVGVLLLILGLGTGIVWTLYRYAGMTWP
jgi:hypothetical protein